ncbi:MAG: hypothetical protein QW320_12040 [Ignisphaera sp.]
MLIHSLKNAIPTDAARDIRGGPLSELYTLMMGMIRVKFVGVVKKSLIADDIGLLLAHWYSCAFTVSTMEHKQLSFFPELCMLVFMVNSCAESTWSLVDSMWAG